MLDIAGIGGVGHLEKVCRLLLLRSIHNREIIMEDSDVLTVALQLFGYLWNCPAEIFELRSRLRGRLDVRPERLGNSAWRCSTSCPCIR